MSYLRQTDWDAVLSVHRATSGLTLVSVQMRDIDDNCPICFTLSSMRNFELGDHRKRLRTVLPCCTLGVAILGWFVPAAVRIMSLTSV